jgi:2-dehydro-3-deoxy-D-gluconate 5-dehydrogenase
VVTADLSVQSEVLNVVPKALELLPKLESGHTRTHIDVLLNCAGIQRRHKTEAFPDNDWNEVRDIA